DLNTPPRLVLLNENGKPGRVLLDPNPGLASRFQLGVVGFMEGTLSTGERFAASLTLPSHYAKGRKYPLVIQSQGPLVEPHKFTLYGCGGEAGLGPSAIAPYASQPLAGRDIAVLHFGVTAKWGGPAEVQATQRAFEELAAKVIDAGIADPDRVGICGFSRMGYFAYQAISHARLSIAAAVVADNVDYSYVQTVLENNWVDAESAIGAPASGAGLKQWLLNATGFNVERITAPLLLIGESGGLQENVVSQWEIISQLRRLHKPVEMYLMPDMDAHPSHNPQDPDQVLAVQERTVDWFDFWLRGHEGSDAAKREQYQRWEKLCDLQVKGNPNRPAFCVRSSAH
ncbi:MAG: hypothetical protein ACRD3Q_20355, partial [Terriglobales bacterium]